MTRRLFVADLAIAAAFALFVLIVSPGLAVVAILAVVVIVVCLASAPIARMRGARARRIASTRSRPPER